MLEDPLDYALSLSDGWYRLSRNSKDCKFSAPATIRGIAKLYTISCKAEIVKEFQLGIKTQMVEKVTVDKDWFMNL